MSFDNKLSTALTIGRYQFAHKGHIEYLVDLTKTYDRVIIGIGSYYEYGTVRNPFLGVDREKMLRKALKYEGVNLNKVKFIGIQDYKSFEKWWRCILKIQYQYNVTHFITGNVKDILEPIKKLEVATYRDIIFINPEENSRVKIHASDIREKIKNGDIEEALSLLHPTVLDTIAETNMLETLLSVYSKNDEIMGFVPGRQAVDVVLFVQDEKNKDEIYVAMGFRSKDKENFPEYPAIPGGGIDSIETSIEAAVRELHEEIGIKLEPINLSSEPALYITHTDVNKKERKVVKLHFVGIFGTYDERWGGTQGGSSQVFGAHIICDIDKFKYCLKSNSDLKEVQLMKLRLANHTQFAYQHNEMIKIAYEKVILGNQYKK